MKKNERKRFSAEQFVRETMHLKKSRLIRYCEEILDWIDSMQFTKKSAYPPESRIYIIPYRQMVLKVLQLLKGATLAEAGLSMEQYRQLEAVLKTVNNEQNG